MTKSNVIAEPKKVKLNKKKKMSKALKPAKPLKDVVGKPNRKAKAAVVRISKLAKDITERQISDYFHQNFPTFKFSCVKLVKDKTGESTGVAHINFRYAKSATSLLSKKVTFLNENPLCAEIVPPSQAGGLFITKKSPEEKKISAEKRGLEEKTSNKKTKSKERALKKPVAKETSDEEEDSNNSDDMDVSIDNSSSTDDEPTPKKQTGKKNLTDKKKGGGVQKKVAKKNKKGGPVVSNADKLKMAAAEVMKVQQVPKVKKNRKLK